MSRSELPDGSRTIASTGDQVERDAAHAITTELEEEPGRAVDGLAGIGFR
jgi:hypothetical protein